MKQSTKSVIKALVNLLFSLVVLLLCIFLAPRLIVLLMPLIVAWIISCMANPLVIFLEKKLKLKRKAGTVFVIIAVIAAICGIVYLVCSILFRQIYGFIKELPDMWTGMVGNLNSFGALINQHIGNVPLKLTEFFDNLGASIGDVIADLPSMLDLDALGGLSTMVGSIANGIVIVIMVFIAAYFFIADREWMRERFDRYVPKGFVQKYDIFYGSLKQAVGGYFKAQFRIEAWMYVLILFGLTFLRVKYSLIVALIIAVIDFLPFFGSGLVLWPWAIITAIGGEYARAVGFLVLWGAGQLVRQLIQPKIMGDSIGMEPIPTIILLFLGYRVGGVVGMLVAVPIGIIVVNMNDAGFFDTPKESVKILVAAFNNFRRLDDADLKLAGKNKGAEGKENGNGA